MKLGTQTGSVINHLHARGTIGQPDPVAGMGATILLWTDRHAATIFRVFKHKGHTAVEVRDDESKVVQGSSHDGSAQYEYRTTPRGRKQYFVFKDGAWREATNTSEDAAHPKLKLAPKGGGHGLRIGSRDTYYDPSF